jgi:hypothetical protein
MPDNERDQTLPNQKKTAKQQADTADELRGRAAGLRWAAERMHSKDGARELRQFADELEEQATALDRGRRDHGQSG